MILKNVLKRRPNNLWLESLQIYVQQQLTADTKKMLLQGFFNKFLKSKIFSEDILVAGCFHLNSKFISKISSPLQRCKSFM